MTDDVSLERDQNFYPLSQLPMFCQLVDEQLEHEHEQLASLQQAESRPYVLDDATVNRSIKLYSEAPEINECYRRQLSRWKKGEVTIDQLQELERLEQQVKQLEQCQSKILKLAKSFKGNTIDQVLGKSDLELGLKHFSDLL